MKRQSLIYAVYSVLSAALVVYLAPVVATSWERLGLSLTTAVFAAVFVLFSALCGLSAWLAFLFVARAVARVESNMGCFLLVPVEGSFAMPVRVGHTRRVRTFGEQFSQDESAPKFTLFAAGSKFWVTAGELPAAHPEEPQ
ncbi:hypothetical protein [uncultured Methylibium sp.]|uniref:hypothetical protein n=1 Tax=uncultured Methylibium sp. TaxID=381093 RepID=UPI0025E534EE|nr:hypothetical protein [uncultured Methylibium sp.]